MHLKTQRNLSTAIRARIASRLCKADTIWFLIQDWASLQRFTHCFIQSVDSVQRNTLYHTQFLISWKHTQESWIMRKLENSSITRVSLMECAKTFQISTTNRTYYMQFLVTRAETCVQKPVQTSGKIPWKNCEPCEWLWMANTKFLFYSYIYIHIKWLCWDTQWTLIHHVLKTPFIMYTWMFLTLQNYILTFLSSLLLGNDTLWLSHTAELYTYFLEQPAIGKWYIMTFSHCRTIYLLSWAACYWGNDTLWLSHTAELYTYFLEQPAIGKRYIMRFCFPSSNKVM